VNIEYFITGKKENGTYTEVAKRFLKIVEHYRRKRKEWQKIG